MDEKLGDYIEGYKRIRNMNRKHESRWIVMFLELIQFKAKFGHADVPDIRIGEYGMLGSWVQKQRERNTSNTIDPAREELLKIIGFNFRLVYPLDWDSMFNKLLAFKEEFGHTRITGSYKDYQLHSWFLHQKSLYWKGKLDEEKLSKLMALGVDMERKRLNIWDRKFQQLVNFKKQHGHLHVCPYYTNDQELIRFARNIRRANNKNELSQERIKGLIAIGFPFNPGKESRIKVNREKTFPNWLKHYEELKAYMEKYGHWRMNELREENLTLSNWIYRQRIDKKLSQKKLKMLKELGFFEEK